MLYATATDENGQTVFSDQRIYMPQCTDSLGPMMVLGQRKKLGIIRDTAFQPWYAKREVFVMRLSKTAKSLLLKLRLVYQHRPGEEITVHGYQNRMAVNSLFTKKRLAGFRLL